MFSLKKRMIFLQLSWPLQLVITGTAKNQKKKTYRAHQQGQHK